MTEKMYISQAEILKALAHPTRIQIIDLLRHGEKCVCEIVPALGLEQPNVSRHLSILKKEGILSCRKEGMKMIYWVSDPRIFSIIDIGSEILKDYWEEKRKVLA